eukprot:CAMPEP_0206199678 /NCGR_PEP_ID=MMETSP0166-20121206/10408_1 /ASSEMBLY_ACC=CAM_ASM_000260 /TAXON_ID=95228 /ORGANISM="Vannella robusta, Strain DIVA3 518/3/11/1/6" /LENGTH=138 /DNA_ID=CAMNT_0053617833 /DNA_START=156 /DNA_END=569 /DNA_ORIENTATION=-
MTEVLAGTKRPFEALDEPVEILSEKRTKVAKLSADPEWTKEEAAEYEQDKEEFTPEPEAEAEDDYYEEEIKETEATEDKILEDLICIKDIMPEGIEFDDESMSAIKALAKDYLVDVFENAKLIAKKIGKRDVVTEEDM